MTVTLILTTISREDQAKSAVASIRGHCPGLPILLGEQTDGAGGLADFCRDMEVDHIALQYDCGISAARNAMVRAIETDYFILAEDDFIFTAAPDFGLCVRFLEANPEFLCVGGDLDDYHEKAAGMVPVKRDRAYNIVIDETGGGYLQVPLSMARPDPIEFEGVQISPCDFIPNWGVFRRSAIVEHDLWWDENFVVGGEHEDFYLRVKATKALRVGYWPDLRCEHHRARPENYQPLRARQDWVPYFSRKWGFRYHHNLGGTLRFFDDYATAIIPPSVEHRRLVTMTEKAEKLGGIVNNLRADRETRKKAYEALRDKLYAERDKVLKLRAIRPGP